MKLPLPQVLSILILQILVVVFLLIFLMVILVVFRSVGEVFLLHHVACLLPIVVLFFFHDRRPFRPSRRYSATELAHLKQHTHCIECGAYGHWRQECPRLISTRPMSIPSTESMRDYHSSHVHFVDVSPSLPSISFVSSLTSEVSHLPAEFFFSHEELFHDTVEQL